ncbi:MAG: acylphosphatase [Candidatus Eisenbacteria bacterium]
MRDVGARRILLRGRVQGVGFRPFVHRLAGRHELSGWVRNLSGQVVIYIEGDGERLDAFQAALLDEAPPLARPELADVSAVVVTGIEGFFIEESAASETKTGERSSSVSATEAAAGRDRTRRLHRRLSRHRRRRRTSRCHPTWPCVTTVDGNSGTRTIAAMSTRSSTARSAAHYTIIASLP